MGFAYYPDGYHNDGAELEADVSESFSDCDLDLTCPAAMYHVGDDYLGEYSNSFEVVNRTYGAEENGLEEYESYFKMPLPEWASHGKYTIKLRFTDSQYDKDLFYFCHVSANKWL
jgi:hypothetical protein